MARRSRAEQDDDRPTILRDTWVEEHRDGVLVYTNCVSGETRSDPPPSHHIVMGPEAYMQEKIDFDTFGHSGGFFTRKKMRAGLRPLRAGTSLRAATRHTAITRRSNPVCAEDFRQFYLVPEEEDALGAVVVQHLAPPDAARNTAAHAVEEAAAGGDGGGERGVFDDDDENMFDASMGGSGGGGGAGASPIAEGAARQEEVLKGVAYLREQNSYSKRMRRAEGATKYREV